MTAKRLQWRDLRFHFFDRNPQLFNTFEASLDELQAMVFDFSERKKVRPNQTRPERARQSLSRVPSRARPLSSRAHRYYGNVLPIRDRI